jgi:hypothetical protein
MCQSCGSGRRCLNQQCVCDRVSCSGCCDLLDICHADGATNANFCGVNGADCRDCEGGFVAQLCIAGSCGLGGSDPGGL